MIRLRIKPSVNKSTITNLVEGNLKGIYSLSYSLSILICDLLFFAYICHISISKDVRILNSLLIISRSMLLFFFQHYLISIK